MTGECVQAFSTDHTMQRAVHFPVPFLLHGIQSCGLSYPNGLQDARIWPVDSPLHFAQTNG